MAASDEDKVTSAEEEYEYEYISDDSSFYGDDILQDHLEKQSSQFSPSGWLAIYKRTVPGIAAAALASAKQPKPPMQHLFNPYEGSIAARQLSESVDVFLQRLPPSTTQESEYGPWIFIANPYTSRRPSSEDWAGFVDVGQRLLAEWLQRKGEIERSLAGRPASVVSRAVTKERKVVEDRLLQEARARNCTTGKWMLFPTYAEVNATWAPIARATAENDLGIAAKVATDHGQGDRVSRLICVYTADFGDMADVRRVLKMMVELGVVGRSSTIYYKCDALTHLGINSGNEYGFKASMYASKDVLQEKAV